MKFMIQALAVAGISLIVACGNSSEKKTTGDTVATTTTPTTSSTDYNSITIVEPPATLKTNFETKYPKASNVRWSYHRPDVYDIDWDWSGWNSSLDTSDYVASYNWDGTDYWSWYDYDGNWIGTVNEVKDHSSLPAAVNSSINTTYKEYTIVSVDKENDKNRTAYEIQLESGKDKLKLLVDENGKIMKKKVISGDTKTKEKMNTDTTM